MASSYLSSVVESDNVWKGPCRLLWAAAGTSFPGVLESVIQPKTVAGGHLEAYAVSADWNDFGGTSEDGVTITREFEAEDGIPVDQLNYNLFEGDPTNWQMRMAATLLETDYQNLVMGWELPTARTLAVDASGPDYNVAQKRVDFSAPTKLTERLMAAVQQHPETDALRVFVFRKAVLGAEGMEMQLSGGTVTGLAQSWMCKADPDVDQLLGAFGKLFEEDAV